MPGVGENVGVGVTEGIDDGEGDGVGDGPGGGHVGIRGMGVDARGPPYGPISQRLPSGSFQAGFGLPASISGESNANPSLVLRSLKSGIKNISPVSATSDGSPPTNTVVSSLPQQ